MTAKTLLIATLLITTPCHAQSLYPNYGGYGISGSLPLNIPPAGVEGIDPSVPDDSPNDGLMCNPVECF